MADVPEIIRFQIDMALESEGTVLDAEKVRAGVEEGMANPAHGEYFTAWNEEGVLMGSLLVTKEWSDWNCCDYWWIQSVYVRPEYRGNKVFTALYCEVRRLAKASGSTCLRLYVDKTNVRAQATYKKLGMDECHYLMYEESL